MDIRITDKPSEAEYYAAQHIPYIVHLHEGNWEERFPSGAFCVERLEDITADYRDRVWRRAHGLPWKICETQRLTIREITVEDVPRLYELYADSSVTRYMEPLFEDIDRETEYTREYIRNIYGFYGYGMWVIVLKAIQKVIGRVGFELKEDFEGLELGFMLGKSFQHKGYAYEACRAAIKYGVEALGIYDYRALVAEDNSPSRRLCERLGFRQTGRVRAEGADPSGSSVPREYLEYRSFVEF
ncbi:MAG: GNAT family N-acetyltransferase [Roseburia sp.]|nr:GNAT family N-acetyltransferase [Roseburia sp.]